MMKPTAATTFLAVTLAALAASARADVAENLHDEAVRAVAQSLRALAGSSAQKPAPEPFVVRGEVSSWFGLQGDFDRAAGEADALCARSGPDARPIGAPVSFKSPDGKAVVVRMCAPDGRRPEGAYVLLNEVSESSRALTVACAARGAGARIVGKFYEEALPPVGGRPSERVVGICGYRP